MVRYSIYIILAMLLFTCSEKETDRPFSILTSSTTGIDFSNDLPLDGELNILNYIYSFNGGGVASGDINNDGLVDLYFTGNQVSNDLFLNKGNFEFENITQSSKTASADWSSGVTMIDINADGWLDIYVCRTGHPTAEKRKNLLFINQKDNTFKEMAQEYNLADNSYSTQAAFFDYDMDGDLDMYLLNHMHEMTGLNNPRKRKLNSESESTDKLYRNNGIGSNGHPVFEDVSKEAGITIEGFGLGIGISDVNQDGFPDIYVSNDFITNDVLYINQGDGTFKNDISKMIKHQSHNGMGNDIADINNDGFTDILVMDMLPSTNEKRKSMLSKPNFDLFEYSKYFGFEPQYMRNTLQLNNGNNDGGNHFSEIGQLAGVSSTDWSWAGLMADFDLDGYKDIYVSNGYLKDMTDLDFIVYRKRHTMFTSKEKSDSIYLSSIKRLPEIKQQNYFYKNNGDLTFKDVSSSWLQESLTFSNGVTYADLDNDGDLDIVTNNINEKASVLKNNAINKTKENTYLSINFKGDKLNPNGLGTKVWIYKNNMVQYAENYTSRGFQSAVSPSLNFGFKTKTNADSLKVIWPDGHLKIYKDVTLGTTQILSYSDAKAEPLISNIKDQQFKEVSNSLNIKYLHEDLMFIDFKREPLIPQNYAFNGPAIAVGDVDGDQRDDFFISGSYNFTGKLYKQNSTGTFDTIPFLIDENHEDLGALFFDADNDGDNDLYVVSGGSELFEEGYYQDRLYLNDGKGNFTKSNQLPEITSSGSCVVAADYDKDGDLDLFVGGRVVPGNYGASPESYLLNNTNGSFKNITKAILGTEKFGMVTSALWTDYDNDGWQDLIVVGEWMPITIYKNKKGKLTQKIEIENTNGWWNSINGGDFDNDGDIDYILGNLGENSVFKASVDRPVTLALGDFDKDGKIDPIISSFSKDEDGVYRSYPFASRDLLSEQMLYINNKFRTYKQYATATIKDIALETPYSTLKVTQLKSSYLENLGNGEFKLHALPIPAQFAPVFGTTIKDVDLDGNLDVVLIGNFYHAEVGYGQYDASLGLCLKGNGDGTFMPQNYSESGFLVNGDARALVQINSKKGDLLMASQNKGSLRIFSQKNTTIKNIRIPDKTTHAFITNRDGEKRKVEFYYGEGYLSQSSRTISIPEDASIEFIKN
ncbi:VCBS repeat-containing protein [Winogradskyella bathintestinalis]|uniref:VCBS repeat-containing protein n=1 Tax=Winogradskyella bathintestinalis TaxID=3035208 RepID=A0ABT7ZWZ8_9FLAO|nr:VCBS repeat-containing protein [Winogradskyella bathintestinalis]MDN3493534.1 VCBS repeat-containing protein [Winogradskyella bathintestinalis]